MVLSTACRRDGIPQALLSDSGGAFTSNAFEAVCPRLQIAHKPIERPKGERYWNWMETHCNVPRRLYDSQCALSTTPMEFAQAHQAFLPLSNPTAPQGRLADGCAPPLPLQGLGEAKGRRYTADTLPRQFAQALLPRTTHQYGWVTLHRDPF